MGRSHRVGGPRQRRRDGRAHEPPGCGGPANLRRGLGAGVPPPRPRDRQRRPEPVARPAGRRCRGIAARTADAGRGRGYGLTRGAHRDTRADRVHQRSQPRQCGRQHPHAGCLRAEAGRGLGHGGGPGRGAVGRLGEDRPRGIRGSRWRKGSRHGAEGGARRVQRRIRGGRTAGEPRVPGRCRGPHPAGVRHGGADAGRLPGLQGAAGRHGLRRPGGPGAGPAADGCSGAGLGQGPVPPAGRRRVPGHFAAPAGTLHGAGPAGRRRHLGGRPEAGDLQLPRRGPAAHGRCLRRDARGHGHAGPRADGHPGILVAVLAASAGTEQHGVPLRVRGSAGGPGRPVHTAAANAPAG